MSTQMKFCEPKTLASVVICSLFCCSVLISALGLILWFTLSTESFKGWDIPLSPKTLLVVSAIPSATVGALVAAALCFYFTVDRLEAARDRNREAELNLETLHEKCCKQLKEYEDRAAQVEASMRSEMDVALIAKSNELFANGAQLLAAKVEDVSLEKLTADYRAHAQEIIVQALRRLEQEAASGSSTKFSTETRAKCFYEGYLTYDANGNGTDRRQAHDLMNLWIEENRNKIKIIDIKPIGDPYHGIRLFVFYRETCG